MFQTPASLPRLEGERLARLRLARTPRVGPVTFHEMLGHYGSAEAALDALPELARTARLDARAVSVAQVQREAADLAGLNGRFIIVGDDDYPAPLAQIADAPPVLSVIGDASLLSRPSVAVVGARNASVNGRRLAAQFAAELGRAGQVIASGLARGIDAAAHEAALSSGTIAVLAGGVDIVYPPENEDLYRAIAEGGAIVSEAPLGTRPQARHFPRRNRIVSGLSAGVLVIEAALQSGSLITARQAAEQGREVFAVPGSPLDPRARGTNRLIRDGAHLVEDCADVLAHLAAVPDAPRPARQAHVAAVKVRPQQIDKKQEESHNPWRDQVIACLGPAPTKVDEVVRRCHVSPAEVAGLLLELELAGRLERHRGNSVSLI
ncbi:MAG: DNA-processing protein DprA [Alphaproteobacteria bacterium]|nr:DNA-processing protein DprA [Alphaproteobacteria bacterium]MCW5739060.1 DNA-processing protein DprA [Alphaproteobacteria bacterium]